MKNLTIKPIKSLPLILLLCLPFLGHAQDPEFTQPLGTPVYFNPAFAGIQQNLRAGLQFRDQWPGVSGSFVTLAAGADMGFPKINSGVGLMFMNDVAGDGSLTTNTINAYYAYEIKLGANSYLRFGVNPSLFQRSINFSQLRFGDQVDPKLGFIYNTQEQLPSNGVFSGALTPDLGAGALFYSKNFYAGLAAFHIFQPAQSFFGNSASMLLRKYVAQAGYYISLGSFTLNPYVLAMNQGTFTQILPGISINKSFFTLGASFRQTDPNADAVNFLFGFAKGIFKVCYSYDQTVSDARAAATGSHELSLVIQLRKRHDTSAKPMIGHLRNSY